MSDRPIDEGRRRLCQAMCAASGLVVLNTVPGCGSDTATASCSASSVGVGGADMLQVGQARFIEAVKVFVCRDEGGYFAVDSACPHVGTDIVFQSASAGFKCPLHGSTFTFEGMVTMGPATTDLKHYSLCTTESGLLVVDTSKRVTADTRLLV